jgi:carboxyl-terminal processing protease
MPVFEEIWNVVNEEYLYPDFNGLDWKAVHEEYKQRIQAGLSDEAFYAAMHEMIRRLGDDHSTYFSPAEAKAEDEIFASDYNYVGIGVFTTVNKEKRSLSVVLIFPNSPAEAAGIQMHDSILAVDGQPVVNEDGTRNNILKGPEGTSIELTVQSPAGQPYQVRVTRQRIDSALPVPYAVQTSPTGKRIGYILIPTFNDSTVDDQVGAALSSMAAGGPLDGLILDNRENGGGNSEILLNTLAYFVNGEVGSFVERQNRTPLSVNANDINGSQRVPLVVLVGKHTASFGEIFAGILQDLGRATIIGEQTEGNVEVLSIYNFSDGSRAWIATSTFRPLNHPDQNWEKTGITPDRVASSRWDEVTLKTDPAVQAAMQYFDQEG